MNKYCTGNPSVLFHRTVELGGISLGNTGWALEASQGHPDPSKFHQAPLVRVVTVVGLEEEQGEREEQRREKNWQWVSSGAAVSKTV